MPRDAARARRGLQPRAHELRHRLVRRRNEPDARHRGEVLQLRQGMPGEHAQRQLLRRRHPQVHGRGARGHARHLR